MNSLDKRKMLWTDVGNPDSQIIDPWCIVGDFNNVLRSKDRISGRLVSDYEFKNLQNMMDMHNLAEMDNSGDYYTWHNKHEKDPIYSRIDKILRKVLGSQGWDCNFLTCHHMCLTM